MNHAYLRASTLAATLGAVAVPAPALQESTCLSEEARLMLPTVVDVRLHPDGEAALYTVVELETVSSSIRYWSELDGSRTIATGSAPAWSPAGDRFAFLATGSDGRQIFVGDLGGNPPEAATEAPGGVSEFAWSPTGDRIAFAANGPDSTRQLHLLDPASGAVELLTDDARTGTVYTAPFGGGGSFDWSPDGRRIALSFQPDGSIEGAYHTDVWLIDVETGTARPVVERPGLDIRPRWSPDGSRIAFATSYGRLNRFSDHGLAVVSVDGGRVIDLEGTVDAAFLDVPADHTWNGNGAIYASAARGLVSVLLSIDVETGESSVVYPPGEETAATLTGASFSADRRRAAVRTTAPSRPWEAGIIDLSAAPRDSWRSIARPAEVGGDPLDWETISWRTADGLELQGLLFHPCGETAGPWPLITWLHGGPEGRAIIGFDPTSPIASPSFDPLPTRGLLARGYAVFAPNFRLSAGYPASTRLSATGRIPEVLESDILSGIDVLIERGIADPERLGLAGWASGGLYAAQLLTRTSRFRAATLGAANTDLEAAYGDGDFPVQWESLQGGPPWSERDAWDAASPLRNAERITSPVLLIHGEADNLVPVEQSRFLFTYLNGLGRDVRLEIIPGAGHGIVLPDHRLRAAQLVYDWFERYLGG